MPLLVLIYIDVLGIDDVVLTWITGGRSAGRRSLVTTRSFRSRWRCLLIQRLRQFVRSSLQLIESLVESFNATFSQCLLRFRDRRFNVTRNCADLLAIVRERFFHLIDESIETVARFDL